MRDVYTSRHRPIGDGDRLAVRYVCTLSQMDQLGVESHQVRDVYTPNDVTSDRIDSLCECPTPTPVELSR